MTAALPITSHDLSLIDAIVGRVEAHVPGFPGWPLAVALASRASELDLAGLLGAELPAFIASVLGIYAPPTTSGGI